VIPSGNGDELQPICIDIESKGDVFNDEVLSLETDNFSNQSSQIISYPKIGIEENIGPMPSFERNNYGIEENIGPMPSFVSINNYDLYEEQRGENDPVVYKDNLATDTEASNASTNASSSTLEQVFSYNTEQRSIIIK